MAVAVVSEPARLGVVSLRSLRVGNGKDEHLDKGLRLSLGLGQAMRNERAEHVGLDLFVWTEAFRNNLLGNSHDSSQADDVLLRRQEALQEGRRHHLHQARQHGQ